MCIYTLFVHRYTHIEYGCMDVFPKQSDRKLCDYTVDRTRKKLYRKKHIRIKKVNLYCQNAHTLKYKLCNVKDKRTDDLK